jgi:hypothetical protein
VWELSGFEFGRQHIEDAFALGETCDKWEDDGRQRPVAKPLVKNTPRCKHGVYTGVRCRDCENEVPLTDAELAEFSRNLNRMRAEQGYPVQDT